MIDTHLIIVGVLALYIMLVLFNTLTTGIAEAWREYKYRRAVRINHAKDIGATASAGESLLRRRW